MSVTVLSLLLIVLAYLVVFLLLATGRITRVSTDRRRRAAWPLYGGTALYVVAAVAAQGRDTVGLQVVQLTGALLMIVGLAVSYRPRSSARR